MLRRITFFMLAFMLGLLFGWYSHMNETQTESAGIISAGAETVERTPTANETYENYVDMLSTVAVGTDLSTSNTLWCVLPTEILWRVTSENGDYLQNELGEDGTWCVVAYSSTYGAISVQANVLQYFGLQVWPSAFVVSAVEVVNAETGEWSKALNTFFYYVPSVATGTYADGIQALAQFEAENNVYLTPVKVGDDLYGKRILVTSIEHEWRVYMSETNETALNCIYANSVALELAVINGAGQRLGGEQAMTIMNIGTFPNHDGNTTTWIVNKIEPADAVYLYIVSDRGSGGGTSGTYDQGYSEGYGAGKADGYTEGYEARESEEAGLKTEWYNLGYNDGYAEGKDVGEQLSYGIGYREGYDVGNADGYRTGYVAGSSTFADNSTTFFGQLFAVFDVEMFGGITIGHIVFIPVILGLLGIVFKVFGR